MGWDGMGWNALGWDGMRWERDVQSYLTHLFSEILVFERNKYTHTHTHTHKKKKEREIDSVAKCISQSRSSLHRFENR